MNIEVWIKNIEFLVTLIVLVVLSILIIRKVKYKYIFCFYVPFTIYWWYISFQLRSFYAKADLILKGDAQNLWPLYGHLYFLVVLVLKTALKLVWGEGTNSLNFNLEKQFQRKVFSTLVPHFSYTFRKAFCSNKNKVYLLVSKPNRTQFWIAF